MKRSLRKRQPGARIRPFTIYLPEDLDRWLRERACEHGRTLTEQTVRVLKVGREKVEAGETIGV